MTLPGAIFLMSMIFVFVPIGIPTLVAFIADVVWAVPAAFISARTARENGYDAAEYAGKGAFYSMLSIPLWHCLMKLMRGEEVNASSVKTGYVLLFIGWFVVGPFVNALLTLLIFSSSDRGIGVPRGEIPGATYFFGIWTIVSLILWIGSIVQLIKAHRLISSKKSTPDSDDEAVEPSSGDALIPNAYILPPLLAKLSILITLLASIGAVVPNL